MFDSSVNDRDTDELLDFLTQQELFVKLFTAPSLSIRMIVKTSSNYNELTKFWNISSFIPIQRSVCLEMQSSCPSTHLEYGAKFPARTHFCFSLNLNISSSRSDSLSADEMENGRGALSLFTFSIECTTSCNPPPATLNVFVCVELAA